MMGFTLIDTDSRLVVPTGERGVQVKGLRNAHF